MFDYDLILASCDNLIKQFASYYTSDSDELDDLSQDLRIKIWESLKTKYDASKGNVYNFVYGIIRLESKKYVLDAHKYRQRFFENNMEILVEHSHTTSDPYRISFDGFIEDFANTLTTLQRSLLYSIIDIVDDDAIYYSHSGKIKPKYIVKSYKGHDKECLRMIDHIRKKLFVYAKHRHMLPHLSTVDAGFS